VQQWEYRVVSLDDGKYTSALNAYGREGWELLAVVNDVRAATEPESRSSLPIPGRLGKLGEAAARIDELGGGGEQAAPASTLLWVLRRPIPVVEADDEDYDYG
jgi:hypothetical protein